MVAKPDCVRAETFCGSVAKFGAVHCLFILEDAQHFRHFRLFPWRCIVVHMGHQQAVPEPFFILLGHY